VSGISRENFLLITFTKEKAAAANVDKSGDFILHFHLALKAFVKTEAFTKCVQCIYYIIDIFL